jgi:hypothetical protein
MTKAALCVHCSDIVSPHRDWQNDRAWRWCECAHMAVRWRDGAQGLIEVTALHGAGMVRVLGFNNTFLAKAVQHPPAFPEMWRELHAVTCHDVPDNYLFHASKRDCWALIVRPGESGDVTFVPYGEAAQDSLDDLRAKKALKSEPLKE